MASRRAFDTSLAAAAVIGSIVLVNILGQSWFVRLDLTRDRLYTLSEASRRAVRELDDRLTITAYLSHDLPPPHAARARFVQDLLDEYYVAAGGHVAYQVVDPARSESAAGRAKKQQVQQDVFGRAIREETALERELRTLGIQPLEVRVAEGDRLEVKRVYMGVVLRYGERREVLPAVLRTSSLEYDLTSRIRKLSRDKVPLVGIVPGPGELERAAQLTSLARLLGQLYQVGTVDLGAGKSVPAEVDAVLVIGPREPFDAAQVAALERFVSGGGSAALFLDRVRVQPLSTEYEEVAHGLDGLLASWGVRVGSGLVADTSCATVTVNAQQGAVTAPQPVQYPLIPLARDLDQDHPLTRGLSSVALPFVSPLEVVPGAGGGVVEVLVTSSPQSWIESPPYDLNPLRSWPASHGMSGPYPLLVGVPGVEGGRGRVLVVGGSSLIQDHSLAGAGQTLVLNMVDWLLADESLLAIRSRGQVVRPLRELDDSTRAVLKYGNIVGAPALFILFGLIRWRLRERRRAGVAAGLARR